MCKDNLTMHWVYSAIVGVDSFDEDFVNGVLRRMTKIYCDPNEKLDNEYAEDRFISFFHWNVDHGCVPIGTYEAFGHEDESCPLEDWECNALRIQDALTDRLYAPPRKHNKKK